MASNVGAEEKCILIADLAQLKTEWEHGNGDEPGAGWEVEEGVIHLRKGAGGLRGGNILSRKEYGDFILEFDFKNSRKGNSGIKYRVQKYDVGWLGFEYQIYDEASFKNVPDRGTTGSIYDLYEPAANKPMNPPGEWNQAKIRVEGNRIEHWLNGVLIAQAEIGTPEWDKRLAVSKFNDKPNFGRNARGRIMLTDHGSEVWIKNFQLTELPTK